MAVPTATRRQLLRGIGISSAILAGSATQLAEVSASAPSSPALSAPFTAVTPAAEQTTLERRARTLVNHLVAGEYQRAREHFSPTLAEQVSVTALSNLWNQLQQEHGTFVEIERAEYRVVQKFDAIILGLRFSDGNQGLRVVFDKQARVAGLQLVAPPDDGTQWSPPEYVDTSAFEVRPVQLSAPNDCTLPAELTVPVNDRPVPGIIIIGGSGPIDMDGTVGPNKPYKDLAYGLSSRGVAVLRYDKRTLACDVDASTLTIDKEVTNDAVTALSRLRTATGIDADRTGVIGHSLGAQMAPRVIKRADGVNTGILLAPPARPLHEIILRQTKYIAALDGTITNREQTDLTEIKQAVKRIRNQNIGKDEIVLGGSRAYWKSLRNYNQFAAACAISTPLLIARGTRDYQVIAAALQRWKHELASRSATDFRSYKTLNHLFISGEGKPRPAEYQIPGHVAQRVVDDVTRQVTTSLMDNPHC